GPIEITENSSTEYKVNAHSDTGITYSWISNPVGIGVFSSTDTASTIFTAPEVETDYPIAIRVVVNSDNDGPVIRSLDVNVLDVPDDEPGDDGDPGDDEDPPEPQNHPPQALAHSEMEIIAGWHTFQFTDDSTDEDGDDDIVKWEWDFTYDVGGGFNVESEEQNPEIRQYEVGIYPVMLRVTDSEGSSDMLDEPLLVEISEIATYVISERRHPQIYEMITDSRGDVFILGVANLEGHLNVEGYLAKYSKGESLEWIKIYDEMIQPDFTITVNEDFYICGRSTLGLGFIMHVDSDGNILNEITSEEITGDSQYISGYYSIDTNPSGNIVVLERFRQLQNETWVEKGFNIQELTPDFELLKQSELFPGYATSLFISESGSIYRSGLTGFTKYNENMERLWGVYTGSTNGNIVVDSDENVYSAGEKLIKFNSDGEIDWKINLREFIWGYRTDIDLYGNRLFIAGNIRNYSDSEVDMDPGPGTQIHELDASDNAFVSIYSLDGEHEDSMVWAINPGSHSNHVKSAVDLDGNMYVHKIVYGVNDLDPGAGTNLVNLGGFPAGPYYSALWKIFPF
ncbi:hypothetical protein KAU08_12810, partial [bacterium]|nr:hypothetical protein [bacterium]